MWGEETWKGPNWYITTGSAKYSSCDFRTWCIMASSSRGPLPSISHPIVRWLLFMLYSVFTFLGSSPSPIHMSKIGNPVVNDIYPIKSCSIWTTISIASMYQEEGQWNGWILALSSTLGIMKGCTWKCNQLLKWFLRIKFHLVSNDTSGYSDSWFSQKHTEG